MKKLKEIKGYMFPCEIKNWKHEEEVMLPSRQIDSGIECECEEKSHKAIKVKVILIKLKKE